jgi:hypothetical protein
MASMQLRVAAAALAFGLIAGCGGDRSRAASSDSTGVARATPDSAAMPVTDTASSRADTSAKTSTAAPAPRPAPASDTGAKPRPAPTHKPKKVATTPPPATHDTAAPAAKPAGDTAARAAAASRAAKQDTSAAKQDTSAAATEGGGELRDAYHQAPRDTVSQAVYEGWKQFNLNCARCHGEDVQGTTIAPHLIVSLKPNGPINSKELFVQTVCAGRPAKGMPAWCALGLDMDKINNIYQYVKGRSDAKISPGRPAVKRAG